MGVGAVAGRCSCCSKTLPCCRGPTNRSSECTSPQQRNTGMWAILYVAFAAGGLVVDAINDAELAGSMTQAVPTQLLQPQSVVPCASPSSRDVGEGEASALAALAAVAEATLDGGSNPLVVPATAARAATGATAAVAAAEGKTACVSLAKAGAGGQQPAAEPSAQGASAQAAAAEPEEAVEVRCPATATFWLASLLW